MGVANGQLIEGRVSRGSRIPLAQPGYLMLHMPHGYLVRIMNIQSPLFSIPSYLHSHCGSLSLSPSNWSFKPCASILIFIYPPYLFGSLTF